MFEDGLNVLKSLPDWVRIAGLVAMLTAGGVALNSRIDAVEDGVAAVQPLPARMNGLEVRVEAVQRSVDKVDDKVDRLLCISEANQGEHGYEQCVD